MNRSKGVDKILSGFGKPRPAAKDTGKSVQADRPRSTPASGSQKTSSTKGDRDSAKQKRPDPPKSGVVPVYFDSMTGSYYARNAHGEYQRWGRAELASLLIQSGYSDQWKMDNGLTPLESEILRITQQKSVHFAGPLGGYAAGIYEVFTNRLLITRGPTLLTPARGNHENLTNFFTDLLGKDRLYFYAWAKIAVESLRAGPTWAVGQLLALAGPPSAGKSVFQKLITPLLGGRVSNPYTFLKGGTNFNADVYSAEHGHLGDEHADPTPKARRNLGAAIKKLVAEPNAYVQGKHKQGITLTPFLRLTLSLNDNSQSLAVLPAFDSDVHGKIMLLRARPDGLARVMKRFRKFQRCEEALHAELPHFLYRLLNWEIPQELRDPRWGVVSFHDPSLVELVNRMSEEERLLELIDAYVLTELSSHGWTGTAFDLEKRIKEGAKLSGPMNFFRHVQHCGDLLTVLASTNPQRVKIVKKWRNRQVYEISPVYDDIPT